MFEVWCVTDCHSKNVFFNHPTFEFGDQALKKNRILWFWKLAVSRTEDELSFRFWNIWHMKQNFQLLSLRFSVTSFLLPIRKYSLRKRLALTDEPSFLPHYSFVRLYVTPFNKPSPRQVFFCLSFRYPGFLPFCQAVLLVLTSKQAHACAGVRQIETDYPSMCRTDAHASHRDGA